MTEINFNLEALNKLNKAFNYANEIRRKTNIGDDTVLYLQDGQTLSVNYSRDDFPKTLLTFRRTRTETQKQLNNDTRELFKQMVIDIFGTSIEDVPKSVRSAMELSKFDGTGRPLTARRIVAVNKAILSAMKGVNKLLGLSGAGAGNIAMIVAKGSRILEAENPTNELLERSNRHAKAQFTTLIAKEIGVNLKEHSRLDDNGALIVDNNTQFYMDLCRNEVVTLKGKKMTVDPDKSRDELVQFITGQKRATFNEADNQTKLRACILMGIVQQGSFACIISGIGTAFDPEGKVSRITPGSMKHFGGKQLQSFALTKDRDGNITISAKIRYTAPVQLGLTDDEGHWFTKKTDPKDSYVEYRGELKLSADEMERLSTVDWTNFDYTGIKAIDDDETVPNHHEAAADLVPADFKFTGDVKVACRIHAQEVTKLA